MTQNILKLREHSLKLNAEDGVEESVRRIFENQMGIDDSILSRLMDEALCRGGDFADLFFEYGE